MSYFDRVDITKYGKPMKVQSYDELIFDSESAKTAIESGDIDKAIKAGFSINAYFPGKGTYTHYYIKIQPDFTKAICKYILSKTTLDEAAKVDTGNYLQDINRYFRRKQNEAKRKIRDEKPSIWSDAQRLLIPDIGAILKLTEDFQAFLRPEYRNASLWKLFDKAFQDNWHYLNAKPQMSIVFKMNTVLTVDRIYIRKGDASTANFSSLTFLLPKGSFVRKSGDTEWIETTKSCRFWLKLYEVNNISCQFDISRISRV